MNLVALNLSLVVLSTLRESWTKLSTNTLTILSLVLLSNTVCSLTYLKAKLTLKAFNKARKNSDQFAASTVAGQEPGININPMADRVYYAHELGHLAAQQTDVGRFVNEMRQNPKLAQAAGIALMTIPGVAAAIEEGDNDLDTSIALAALTSAPVLADEALATINAQQIMDKAQIRTSLGQRGKLAGGLLSYLAAPVIAGAAGNVVGNMLD